MTIISSDTALGDSELLYSIATIRNQYGDEVSCITKSKSLLKFGNNPDLDTGVWETVWEPDGDEVYVTTNAIDTVSSSDAADTVEVTIEGHTVTGTGLDAQFTFVIQTATLNGQNKVTLTTPLARVSRISNNEVADIVGDVHVYEDTAITAGVPADLTKAHIMVKGTVGHQQSYKAATTFSNTDYYLITNVMGSITRSATAAVDFELQVRKVGKNFRPVKRFSVNSTGSTTYQAEFHPYLIVPKNADVRIRAVSTANNTAVNASFNGYILAVV